MSELLAVSRDVEQTRLIFSILLGVLTVFAIFDAVRFSSATFRVFRQIQTALICLLLSLFLATLIVLFFLHDPEASRSLIVFGTMHLVWMALFFLAGYTWIRRYRYKHPYVRQDLLWKRRIEGHYSRRPMRYRVWPRIAGGLAVGLLLAFISSIYFTIYAEIWNPDYIQIAEKEMLQDFPTWLVIFMALIAPITEELMFRWYLLHRLQHLFRKIPFHRMASVMLSAAVWAVGHAYAEPVYVKEIQIITIGVALGWLFPRLGLAGCIAAHLMINIVGLSTLLLEWTG